MSFIGDAWLRADSRQQSARIRDAERDSARSAASRTVPTKTASNPLGIDKAYMAPSSTNKKTKFTYLTRATTDNQPSTTSPYNERVLKEWNDTSFRSAECSLDEPELSSWRDISPAAAQQEQIEITSGVKRKDASLSYGPDSEIDWSVGYDEDKLTEDDIYTVMKAAIPGYHPLTQSQLDSIYSNGDIDGRVIYLYSRHIEGYHNRFNLIAREWMNRRRKHLEEVSIEDPYGSRFGMKQSDQHGRMLYKVVDSLIPTVTESQRADKLKGKHKVDLTLTGLNVRHLHTADMGRLAQKEMATLDMIKAGAPSHSEAEDIPTIAVPTLNETQFDSGFCRASSVKDAAKSYMDGRAVARNKKTGIVPWREEKSEEAAISRIMDNERNIAKLAQKMMEWKVFKGEEPTVILDIVSSCQFMANRHKVRYGEGGKDGRALIMRNMQTMIEDMTAKLSRNDKITLSDPGSVYDQKNLVPSVTEDEVKGALGADKSPGIPGTNLDDIGVKAWVEGTRGPEHREPLPWQSHQDKIASQIMSDWSTLSDEEKKTCASAFELSVDEVESDPETFAQYVAQMQIISKLQQQQAASKSGGGSRVPSSMKTGGIDTGIRADLGSSQAVSA